MSRIGRRTIELPSGVTVELIGSQVKVKGPKGELTLEPRPEIEVKVADNAVTTSIKIQTKQANAYWGLTNALINNMVKGVAEGFEKKLELVGVGYRATSKGDSAVSLAVGYSHPVEYVAPEGVKLAVEDSKIITVTGIDKHLVGLAASNIRKIRKPEPYKGKGIKYTDEVIRRKAGKSGAA